jgi:hypothetical protein
MEGLIALDIPPATWQGHLMHTGAPTIRGQVVPQWATTREVRPAERAAWRTVMATHNSLGFRGFVGCSCRPYLTET